MYDEGGRRGGDTDKLSSPRLANATPAEMARTTIAVRRLNFSNPIMTDMSSTATEVNALSLIDHRTNVSTSPRRFVLCARGSVELKECVVTMRGSQERKSYIYRIN